MEGNEARFQAQRRKAEYETHMGGVLPKRFASVLCMQNTPPSRSAKSMVQASAQGKSGIPAAAGQMRRVFGSCGAVARQDVWAATDMQAISRGDDYVALTAYRKVEKQKEKEN